METGLRLLMRDGVLHIQFRPRLSADEYTELLVSVGESHTVDDFRMAMKRLAEKWGKEVAFDTL